MTLINLPIFIPLFLICLFVSKDQPCSAEDLTSCEILLDKKDLSHYEVFTDGFPKTLYFRSGEIVNWNNRRILSQHLGMFDADTRKYVGEETTFRQDWVDIMKNFKEHYPRKLSLLHLNGEARAVYQEEGHKYFPGHWTFYPGDIIREDLLENESWVSVSDVSLFTDHTFRKRERGQLTEILLSPVVIVPLDSDGSKKWGDAEFAEILEVDAQSNSLKLKRGQYFTKVSDFYSKQAYIASIHSEYWGGGTMWTLNLSSKCPLNDSGKTAADIWLEEIATWCAEDGAAAHVDGIGFDVIFYKAKHHSWDLDVDGRIDNGIGPFGEDFNTQGQHTLLKRLRGMVGPNFILTSDSWEHKTQRAVGVFNGMESEGLCMPNDGWRKISQTINAQRYWAEQSDSKYNYSYITSKLRHPDDIKISDQLYRVGLGMACLLEVSYTQAKNPERKDGLPMIPEMHLGSAMKPNWLGKAVGEIVELARRTPDLLNNDGVRFSNEILGSITTQNCSVSVDTDGSLLIIGNAENPFHEMEFTLHGIEVPEGDLSVFFEALSLDPLTGFKPTDRIPRQIVVHADGMPDTPSDQMGERPMYNDIMALMGASGWQENCVYFRNAGGGDGKIKLTFRIENQGGCKIRNLTAHNSPLGMAREFENGVVLVNPSKEQIMFNMEDIFPDYDTAKLWRIKVDSSAYDPSPATRKMLSIHNGKRIESHLISMPALEALFLSKYPQN